MYRDRALHIEVLDRTGEDSSPLHVLLSLDEFKRTYNLNNYDELWLVIDRDTWTARELTDVTSQCHQKLYFIAMSNPCFELWLLLHITSLDDYSESDKKNLIHNRSPHSKKRPLERELTRLLGSYNKSNIDTSKFLPSIASAVARAKQLDVVPVVQWPAPLSTRVYLLIESLEKRKK